MSSNPTSLAQSFAEALRTDWSAVARPEQLEPPGDWTTWVFCGGRGSGKTRSGSEWIRQRVESGVARWIHLIAPTAGDARDVMLEGPAGILSTASSHCRPVYQPSLRKVVWPNGVQALLFSADEPDRLRGPQCDTLWIDELCAMRSAQDVLDMAMFGLRLGKDPRALITTTPRPVKPFKALLARDGQDVRVVRCSTMANAENLAKPFLQRILAQYAGTRLGRQEIDAELLTDTPGALWSLERIEELRVGRAPAQFERVVVAIDPAVTFGPDADETGIVVAGLAADGKAYVLDDLSGKYPPVEWATRAINAYRAHSADRIIAEVNNGGALVETTLRSVDPGIPFKAVHASRGKLTRAEPVSALYEQRRVHHVGSFAKLEDQMSSYDGSREGGSPDRLDALCWGLTELMLGEPEGGTFRAAAFLERPSVESAPVPVAVPVAVRYVMAVAAADASGDNVGVVYVAAGGVIPAQQRFAPMLTVLDWGLYELVDGAIPFEEVHGRLQGYHAACRYSGQIPTLVGCAEGVCAVILSRAAALGRRTIDVLTSGFTVPRTLEERVLGASKRLHSGAVRFATEAAERVATHQGVSKNHLFAHLSSYRTGTAPTSPLVLLDALALAVLLADDGKA